MVIKMDAEICQKMQDLKLTYEKVKTKDGAFNDVKKISSFLSNTCNSDVFDYAFTKFIEINMPKASYKCLLNCVGKIQKQAAHKFNTEYYNNSDCFDDL